MSQPHSSLVLAEALTPAEINSYYENLSSQPNTPREASYEGWRILETGLADPNAELDIPAIQSNFNRALTYNPLTSEANFIDYTSARIGSTTLGLFIARKEERRASPNERAKVQQGIGEFLGELIVLNEYTKDSSAATQIIGAISRLIAAYSLISRPLHISSPRESYSGYLIVTPQGTPQRFPVRTCLINGESMRASQGSKLPVGHVVARVVEGRALRRKELISELVTAQTITVGSLMAAKASGAKLDTRENGLLHSVSMSLHGLILRDYHKFYPTPGARLKNLAMRQL